MKNQIFQMSDYVVGLLAIARYCDFHLIYVSLYLYFLLLNSLGIAVKDWKKYVYIYDFSFFFFSTSILTKIFTHCISYTYTYISVYKLVSIF